ncbi:MAG: MATE family efflux transporter [Eubacteriales bacterium]|nr:MATE family efflux transporter [Eubacteriales bacterium]
MLSEKGSIIRWEPEFTRRFFRIAVPIILQMLVSASLNLVDNFMVSSLGDDAYSAVSQANRYTFVFQIFLFGCSSGSAIFLSQFWGKRDVKSVQKVMAINLRISVLVALLFASFAMCAPEFIASWFLRAGASRELAADYLRIVALGYLIQSVDNCFSATLKSCERTNIPMIAAIISILVNTFMNFCLIYGNFGLPRLGVKGAAIATVFAAAVSLTINVTLSYRKRLPSAINKESFILPDKAFMKRFAKTILPVILNEGLWSLGMMMYSVFYGNYGNEVVSGISIFNTIDNIIYVLIYGIMNSSAIIVGMAIGADDFKAAKLYSKRMLIGGVMISVVLGIVMFFMRDSMVSLFSGVSDTARSTASVLLMLVSFALPIKCMNSVMIVGILRAGGDSLFSMILEIGTVWGIGVPLLAMAVYLWGLPIQLAFLFTFAEEIVKIAISLPRYISGKWMHNLVKTGRVAKTDEC